MVALLTSYQDFDKSPLHRDGGQSDERRLRCGGRAVRAEPDPLVRLVAIWATRVVVGSVALLMAQAAFFGVLELMPSARIERPGAVEVRRVHPGETLWSIAAERKPKARDLRREVDRLVELNGNSVIVDGSTIHVPVP